MIKELSPDWFEDKIQTDESGCSEKVWLRNKKGERGLFKYIKNEQTTEHISESIASDLCILLGLKCAKITIGTYNGRSGSLSHTIANQETHIIIEGIGYISPKYENYDTEKLYCKDKEEYYSLEMILNSLSTEKFKVNIINMLLFDFIIGNSDRHHSNWAIIRDIKEGNEEFCPLYDNGSSLCCYENHIEDYLGNDYVKFNALCDSKSKTLVRINKKDKKKPTHKEMLEHIIENYYEDAEEMILRILKNLTKYKTDEIVCKYDNSLSLDKQLLIKKFILEKKKILEEIIQRKERLSMAIKSEEYVYVIWKETLNNTRRNYVIGELYKNEDSKYIFKYCGEIDDAIENGFDLITGFNDRDKIYESEMFFPVFKSRVPERKRRDIDRILQKYNLKEYDAFEILKASSGRLPRDTLAFEKRSPINNEFYLQGCRHYLNCDGSKEKCPSTDIAIGDQLYFEEEPENEFDKNAVKVMKENNLIGYIPKYYTKEIKELLKVNKEYKVEIIEYNYEYNCQECIKIVLKVEQ